MATTSIVAPIVPDGTPTAVQERHNLPLKPILAYSRTTGDMLELVPSASQPGKFHVVDPVGRTCDCRGFQFRRQCRHLSPLAPSRPLADGGAAHLAVKRAAGEWPAKPHPVFSADKAAQYRAIFGSDE